MRLPEVLLLASLTLMLVLVDDTEAILERKLSLDTLIKAVKRSFVSWLHNTDYLLRYNILMGDRGNFLTMLLQKSCPKLSGPVSSDAGIQGTNISSRMLDDPMMFHLSHVTRKIKEVAPSALFRPRRVHLDLGLQSRHDALQRHLEAEETQREVDDPWGPGRRK